MTFTSGSRALRVAFPASIMRGLATSWAWVLGHVVCLALMIALVPRGAYAQVPNPELEAACGLDIVLVLDGSGSIDDTEYAQMQAAFVDFVEAFLVDSMTPTEFAVVEFATSAVVRLGFTGDAQTIIDEINEPRVQPDGQFTNWDDGLRDARLLFPNRTNPDLLVFSSDGDPNRRGGHTDLGHSASVQTVTAANAVAWAVEESDEAKTNGVRVLSIGIGGAVTVSNLEAVASPDATFTSDFDQLADDLAALAMELCAGTITVHKVIDEDGNLGTAGDQSNGAGWTFDANVDPPDSSMPASGDTDGSGLINFDIDLGGDGMAMVDIVETLEPNFVFLSASCTDQDTNPIGTPGSNMVEDIDISSLDIVSCTFYNQPDCSFLDSDCTDGVYNPGTGQCEADPKPASTPCTDTDANACTTAGCDGAGSCDQDHVLVPGGTACGNPADTECDNPDTCDGAGGCLPNNEGDGTSCGDAGGECINQDTCVAGTCQDNGFPVNGTPCGDPADTDCDDPDTCDGAGGCLPNNEGDGTSCGDAGGECINQDTCVAGTCQDNGFPVNGTPCGDPADTDCDNPDTCDGAGGCLPNNEGDGTDCGDAGGECINQDTCVAGTCQDNGFPVNGTPCGDPADTDCDNPDTCDGAGGCLPNNEGDGTDCGDAGGECINQDTCVGGTCQDNGFPVNGTPCGDPADTDCDNPDTCDGAGGCQPNNEGDGTNCGDAADTDCTDPDTCVAGACQSNDEPSGNICGDSSDTDCTDPDTCNGTGGCQSNDEPDGTTCGDVAAECEVQDTCVAGSCQDNGFQPDDSACGDPGDACTNPDTCDGNGGCTDNGFVPDGSACDDGNPCTTEACDGEGSCEPLTGPDHFKCYKTKQINERFERRDVDLVDQFGASIGELTKPRRFCNPTNSDFDAPVGGDEGPFDPAAHLMCYRLKEPTGSPFDVIVENQFGTWELTAKRADTMCAPAELLPDPLPEPLPQPSPLNLNHFKCYKVKRTKGGSKWTEVVLDNVTDEFETKITRLIKPSYLCNPVDKNGEGIECATNHLLCYRIKDAPGQPKFVRRIVDVRDQFGVDDHKVIRGDCRQASFFCVPSTKRIASPSGAFVERETSLLD